MLAAAVLLCCPCQAAPSLSAERAVVLDAESGRVLFAKEAETPGLIASTTKIMTGLLVAEQCKLQELVTIPQEAVGVEGSSIYLQTGEVCTVEELLYGMLLHSGNDAATALAIHCAGREAAFVEQMNEKARELGLEHTSFANPHGLDSEYNHASAIELAKLTAIAMENPLFYRVVSTKTAKFEGRVFTNHNKLLWRYDGTVGVKTGYTRAAGRILVSCVERNGRRLIAVTMNAPDDWRDHEKLLDFCFEQFRSETIITAGQSFGKVPVISGSEQAEAVAMNGFIYPLSEAEFVSVQCQLPGFVYAPVLAGEQAGQVIVLLHEEEIARIPLVWRYSVMEGA